MNLPPGVVGDVDAKVENELLKEIVEDWNDELVEEVEHAYPDFVISPAVKLGPKAQLMKALALILQGPKPQPVIDPMTGMPAVDPMTGEPLMQEVYWDEMMAQQELAMLLNPDYVELMRNGLMPPPVTTPWVELSSLPPFLDLFLRRFRSAYRQYLPEMMGYA